MSKGLSKYLDPNRHPFPQNDVLGAQDEVTVTILAVVVAIAMAAVLAASVCLVYSRVKARRRRIRIHNVITDLQSRDKIVLMNSDESEEE